MIDKIKKYDNLIVFVVIILISMGFTLGVYVNTGDELWNFNNAYKFFYGSKMYTDMNIIIPPIFFYIVNVIFHIIGANALTFKIIGVLIYAFENLLIYNIFKALKINKKNAICYLLIMQPTFMGFVIGGANYNLLAIAFALLGVFTLINSKSKYNWALQGIITYLVLFTKQNIGVYYLLAVFIIEFILHGINMNSIKQLAKQIVITIILSALTLLHFYLQGNLYDFINYTILGISEFTKNFMLDTYLILLILIDIIILGVTIFLCKKRLLEKEKIENLIILSVFSIVFSLVIYPIINVYHVKMALIFPFITLFYILHFLIFKEFDLRKIIDIISIIILTIGMCFSLYFTCSWVQNANFNLPYSHPYYGGMMEQEIQENIKKIDEYILHQEKEGQNVIILSKEAGLYMLPLQKNNGVFDLPFLGNLGKEGEEGLIKQISNLKNCKILIKKGELFWQESQKANDYIKQNHEKTGEIEEFEIYE